MNTKARTILIVLVIVVFTEGKQVSRRTRSNDNITKVANKSTVISQSQPESLITKAKIHLTPSSLVGWQNKPARKKQSKQPRQPTNTHTHSYPSSHTGLSGNKYDRQTVNQQNTQRNNVPENNAKTSGHSYPSSQTGLSGNGPPNKPPPYEENSVRSNAPINNQNPSYPASNGLSGSSGSEMKYPQGNGLSGTGNAAAPPSYSGNNYPSYSGGYNPNNVGPYNSQFGNNYHTPLLHNYHKNGSRNSDNGNQVNNYNSIHLMPGYFGNYRNGNSGVSGVSKTGNALKGVGMAGVGVGTLLTGLALWNLARSTGNRHHNIIYENGKPVAVEPSNVTELAADLSDKLVNCSLTINTDNSTEVLMIPCNIATSFTPDANVKDVDMSKNLKDTTECLVTVVTKGDGKEHKTPIPCSILLQTAAENNVTESPVTENDFVPSENSTVSDNPLISQTNA